MIVRKKKTDSHDKVPDEKIVEALKQRHIYATNNRIKVLATAYLLKRNISTVSVLKAIDHTIERTSVHRALRLFCKKGLLMPVPSINGLIEYELTDQPVNNHLPMHASFICVQCGKHGQVMIMNESFKHYKPVSVQEVVLKGLCEQCGRV